MHRIFAALLLLATCTVHGDEPKPKPPGLSWIWVGPEAAPRQVAYFRKTFELKDAHNFSGRLIVTADDAAEVFINGDAVITSKGWSRPGHAGITGRLREGKNVVAVKATNVDGDKAGLLLRIEFDKTFADPTRVETNNTWKQSTIPAEKWNTVDFDDASWSPAHVVAPVGGPPWGAVTERVINALGRSAAAGATPAEKLKLPPGFRAELLYSVPREQQGSWVSMCVDPRGRLIVCDQYGGLFRVTPPPVGQLTPTVIAKLPIDLGEAQGLLWAFDSLYVVVNHAGKYKSGLWRVRAEGDGFAAPELLRELHGNGEHGPHAVLLHPDGRSLCVVIGNHTKLTDCSTSRVPRLWAEDQIIPRMWDARGHARGILAPGGHIVRCDPDGKNWELMAIGFRNAYDAAFSPAGDLFTYDSDMEWDANTPWYRPTRVYHVVSGADYGWRSGSGKWPSYYPETLPPVLDIGPGSPTGMTFGTGARFPAKYQRALFCCDWSYGKLYAVHLTARGSSYAAEAEEFVSGLPLPLTDLVINPRDGALYFAIGGRKTTSGLYRVTYTGPESTRDVAPTTRNTDEQALRGRLELLHEVNPRAIDDAWPHLGHADRFVRSAARIALEHQPVETWRSRAAGERDTAAALTALTALARCETDKTDRHLAQSLERMDWSRLTPAQKLALVRVYQLAVIRELAIDRPAVAARFSPLFPGESRDINSEIAKLLVAVEDPGLAAKAVPRMLAAPTQEEQMDYANTLKSLRVGWTADLRRQYFGWFEKAAGYRGGASFGGFCTMIQAEAAATLSPEERALFRDLITPKPRIAAAPPKPRPFVKKYTTDELVAAIDGQLTGRNFDRGQELFAATRCAACHRFDNDGGANGPDLTGAAGRFSLRDLVEAIVEPSKVIGDQYGAVVVATADGKVITGRIVNLIGDSIMLNTDMLDPNAIVTVNRNLIESQEPSKVSMMPDGLIDTCTLDEVKDLIAYLLSKGDRKHAMFSK